MEKEIRYSVGGRTASVSSKSPCMLSDVINVRWIRWHSFIIVAKQCIAVSINLAFTNMGNLHAIWDRTVLPVTQQRCESRFYP